MPISGRLRITSIRLPTHIGAIRPQNNRGLAVMTWTRLDVVDGHRATISAITAFGGMPSVSWGMKEVCTSVTG